MKQQSRADARRIIRAAIDPRHREKVFASLRAAIGFKDGRLGREPAAIGTTRFGGRPDLPPGLRWPGPRNRPLAFVGQVNLAEVHRFDAERLLPRRGVLAFFVETDRLPSGTTTSDRKRFDVQFFEDPALLRRRDFPDPLPPSHRIEQCRRVRPYTRWMLTTSDTVERRRLGLPEAVSLDDPLEQSIWAADSRLTAPFIPVGSHQLLGWADGMYNICDQRIRCAAAADRFREGRTRAERDRTLRKWMARAKSWRCLLQVGSDESLYGQWWGDGGTLGYFIREQDLRAGFFDNCWCVVDFG